MLRIEDYYTDAPSAGIITMLEKPEVVNRLMNTLICNFKGFDYMKMKIEMHAVKEELEEYKNLNQMYLNQIQKLHVYYDGHQLALKRILRDINYDTHLNTKVYSPVIGCPVGCPYCFTKNVVNHFGVTADYKKPVFRGFYKIMKDSDGNDVPELFNIESENPIDWFLTYMSDFGCWRPEWQENVLQQIIAANNIKRRKGKCLDTFQLVTKCPDGIDLTPIPADTDIRNVVISCTVDRNECTHRIPELIKNTKGHLITGCVVYQPVLEHIEPVYLDELVKTFGKDHSWVIIGGEIGKNAPPFHFEWIKDIVDRCIELGISVKMQPDIKQIVKANGYEFFEQEPKPIREAKEIRKRNLAMKDANISERYKLRVAELNRRLTNCVVSEKTGIATLVMLSDVEMIVECAKRLLALAPDFDVILSAETKALHLVYEMARQSGKNYIVAHKSVKLYMNDAIEVAVKSVTTEQDNEHFTNDKLEVAVRSVVTENEQRLYLEAKDVESVKGKRVLIVDDVISKADALKALEALVEKADGITAANAALIADGSAAKRNDLIFLEALPDNK